MLEKIIEWFCYAMLVVGAVFCTNIISDQYNIWGFMHWAGEMLK